MSKSTKSRKGIEQISEWFTKGGGRIHPAVEIVYSEYYAGYSLQVRTGQHLPAGSQVVSCPQVMVLSVLSMTQAAEPWPEQLMSRWASSPEVLTRVFLMEQFLEGQQSFWYPYTQLLPQPEDGLLDTPMFYSEEDSIWIEGTNVEGARVAREKLWREEYGECMSLLRTYDRERYEVLNDRWELYKWAATILTSRCFSSSAFDMTGMSPQSRQSRDETPDKNNLTRTTYPPFPILLPVFDIANHNPSSTVTWSSQDSSCSFTVHETIAAGKEVCISYDNKSNEELILGYGFSLFRNPEDAFGIVLKDVSASKNMAYVLYKQQQASLEQQKDSSSPDSNASAPSSVPATASEVQHQPGLTHSTPKIYLLRAPTSTPFFLANHPLTANLAILLASSHELPLLPLSPPLIPTKPTHLHALITSTLLFRLLHSLFLIATNTPRLPVFPRNARQFHAVRYRRSQIHILETNIAALRWDLQGMDTETTRLMRLEDLLGRRVGNEVRRAAGSVLRTRDAGRVREGGWVDLVFVLWACGSWVGGRDVSGAAGGIVEGWLEWVGGVYGRPGVDGGARGDAEEVKEGDEEEDRRVVESYLDAVRVVAERYPESVFAERGWGVELLRWGLKVVRGERLVVPGVGGEGKDEEEDEFVVFVSRGGGIDET